MIVNVGVSSSTTPDKEGFGPLMHPLASASCRFLVAMPSKVATLACDGRLEKPAIPAKWLRGRASRIAEREGGAL